jgi:hypothetical protein
VNARSAEALHGGVPERALALLDRIARRARLSRAVELTSGCFAVGGIGWSILRITSRNGVLPPSVDSVFLAGFAVVWIVLTLRVGLPRGGDRALAARHLDRVALEAGDGATLLLADAPTPLLGLERVRVAAWLARQEPSDFAPGPRWGRSTAGVLLGVATIAAVLSEPAKPVAAGAPPAAEEPAVRLPMALQEVATRVVPPTYLGAPARAGDALGVTAEEGARIEWRVRFAGAPQSVAMVIGDATSPLLPVPGDDGVFVVERVATTTEILALVARRDEEVWRSPAARLTVIPDEVPEVSIVRPPSVVERKLADLAPLEFAVEARDDHAVGRLELAITVAAGAGEGVTFEERRLPLTWRAVRAAAAGDKRAVEGSTTLDLRRLGLGPGSELYVVAEARDEAPPFSAPGGDGLDRVGRSEPVVVRVLAEGGETTGLGNGIVLRNELEALRSQRQVLIDTERLVARAAERPGLAREEFELRSHTIGLDQLAVRQRYGELLGQEFEDGRAIGPEAGAAAAAGSASGDALDAVPEDLMHLHDSAEMATFFDDPVRHKLRDMLSAMWDAELRLRTFRPQEALPFERRALKLLKEVQEASRVYVPKFGSALPPFDERRRLSGDRSKVRDVALSPEAPPSAEPPASRWWHAVHEPSAWLDGLAAFLEGQARRGALDDLTVLDAARRLEDARSAPGSAAAAGERAADADEDARTVERGLWTLIAPPSPAPGLGPGASELLERLTASAGSRRSPGGGR